MYPSIERPNEDDVNTTQNRNCKAQPDTDFGVRIFSAGLVGGGIPSLSVTVVKGRHLVAVHVKINIMKKEMALYFTWLDALCNVLNATTNNRCHCRVSEHHE